MKQLRHSFNVFVIFALALMLSACSGPILQKPVSAEDYMQNVKAQIGAAYKTIGDLKANRSINQAQGQSAFAKVDKFETRFNLIESAVRGGASVKTFQGELELMLAGLLAIQAELRPKA
jgi:hypothetical protein